MKRIVIFDFDGTLADTSEGIINSHRYAHQATGHTPPSDQALRKVIGGPLLETYRNKFGFSETEAVLAVKKYRDWYSQEGIKQVRLYEGIKDLLQLLKNDGFMLGIATLKADRFVRQMTVQLDIAKFFDTIHGIDQNDSLTKADLIHLCMADVDLKPKDTILVGDSLHDIIGAQECGCSFIGVSYGFGLKEGDTLKNIVLSDAPEDVYANIFNLNNKF